MSAKSEYPDTYKAKDTLNRTRRHLNFSEHECCLHCRTPGTDLGENQTELISPPWAGVSSGFTLLFEALITELRAHMPVHSVCQIIREQDKKIWRLLEKYAEQSPESEDCSHITAVGTDETGRTRGHNYITLFVDMLKGETVQMAEGKDHKTVVHQFINMYPRTQRQGMPCLHPPGHRKTVYELMKETV